MKNEIEIKEYELLKMFNFKSYISSLFECIKSDKDMEEKLKEKKQKEKS